MWKVFFCIMLNLPFILYVILMIYLYYYIGLFIVLDGILVYGILLFLIGICLSLNCKKATVIGSIAIIINFSLIMIAGYIDSLQLTKYDSIKWNFYFAISLTLYYLLMYFFKNYRVKKNNMIF